MILVERIDSEVFGEPVGRSDPSNQDLKTRYGVARLGSGERDTEREKTPFWRYKENQTKTQMRKHTIIYIIPYVVHCQLRKLQGN